MEWDQVWTIIFCVCWFIGISLFFILKELKQINKDINTETRDFHGRLCRLEERFLDIREKKL